MSEDGEARFREPKTVYKERESVEKAIPSSTNFWRMANFLVGSVAPVLDRGAL